MKILIKAFIDVVIFGIKAVRLSMWMDFQILKEQDMLDRKFC